MERHGGQDKEVHKVLKSRRLGQITFLLLLAVLWSPETAEMALQHFHSHMRNHRGNFCFRVELEAVYSMILVDFRGNNTQRTSKKQFSDLWIEQTKGTAWFCSPKVCFQGWDGWVKVNLRGKEREEEHQRRCRRWKEIVASVLVGLCDEFSSLPSLQTFAAKDIRARPKRERNGVQKLQTQ